MTNEETFWYLIGLFMVVRGVLYFILRRMKLSEDQINANLKKHRKIYLSWSIPFFFIMCLVNYLA